MQLGNKKRFAIQWDLDLKTCGPLLLGRVCYWVTDTMIGDYDLGTALSDVLASLTYPVGDCGDRDSSRFCSLAGFDAFSLVHRGLFDSDDAISREVEDERWARFDVSLPVDVFDHYRMYCFDCGTESRLLVGSFQENTETYDFLLEQRLRRGEFDEIVRSFQTALLAAAPS